MEESSRTEEMVGTAKLRRGRGRPKRTNIDGEEVKQLLGEALMGLLGGNLKSKQLASDIVEERQEAQRAFVSERERQLQEPHKWITFHRMGELDQVTHVFIGAAGVAYNIRKGERVPLPQSAIGALELAVREGLDHGHPVVINGRKYLRKIKESEYSYTIDGPCSPEEAAEWKAGEKRANAKDSDLVQVGGQPESDMVEIGPA